MARYTVGVRTGAGSTTLPLISLYGLTSPPVRGLLREIGLTNTTDVEVAVKLVRLSDLGTPGSGLVEAPADEESPIAACAAYGTHSVGPTLGVDLPYRATLGAAKGAGTIWTFGDAGLRVKPAKGIGVIIAVGTGQPLDAYMVWDE